MHTDMDSGWIAYDRDSCDLITLPQDACQVVWIYDETDEVVTLGLWDGRWRRWQQAEVGDLQVTHWRPIGRPPPPTVVSIVDAELPDAQPVIALRTPVQWARLLGIPKFNDAGWLTPSNTPDGAYQPREITDKVSLVEFAARHAGPPIREHTAEEIEKFLDDNPF